MGDILHPDWHIPYESFETICRICLESSETLIPIEEIYFTRSCGGIQKEISISKVFRKYCDIKVKNTDSKPCRLCKPCTNKAYNAFKLFEQVVESNTILDDLIKEYGSDSDTFDLPDLVKIESDDEPSNDASDMYSGPLNASGQAEFIMVVPEDKKINLQGMQNIIKILNRQDPDETGDIHEPIEEELKKEVDCENTFIESASANGECSLNAQGEFSKHVEHLPAKDILKWDHTYSSLICEQIETKNPSVPRKSKKRIRPSVKNIFTCNVCEDIKLPGMDSVIKHIKDIHPSSKRCILCPKELQWPQNVIIHVASHSNSGKLVCKKCLLYFENVKLLQQHQASKEHKAPFSCNICNKFFMRRYTLKLHNEEVHLKQGRARFQCPICGLILKWARNYEAHLETHSDTPKIKKHLCEFCAKGFFRGASLKAHVLRAHVETKIRNDSKKYKCEFCPKTFASSGSFFMHRISHPECTSINCQYCDEIFTSAKDFRVHRRAVHNNFICDICQKGFPTKLVLYNHKYLHKRQFSCSHCDARFTTRQNCQNHEIIHTGERPFRCEYCEKQFKQQAHLNKHIESMHTEKPLKCSVCDKRFVFEWAYRSHFRTHTGEKPFVCPYCEKDFRDTVGRHKHVKRDHPDKMQEFLLFKKVYQGEEVKVADC